MSDTTTPFSTVYDAFLAKITDDMFMELSESETNDMLEEYLIAAIHYFEFPKVNLSQHVLDSVVDETIYCGADSNYDAVTAIIHQEGYFEHKLTAEEINILATYMIVEWFNQQLASIENVRMKYSGSDFKFTSQANHMQKLLNLKQSYISEGFHLQRLYNRRAVDKKGKIISTFGSIMDLKEDS